MLVLLGFLWVSLTSGFAVATLSYAFSTCSNLTNCAVSFVLVAVVKFLRLAGTCLFRCSVVEVSAWCCHPYLCTAPFFSSCIGIHIAQLVTMRHQQQHTPHTITMQEHVACSERACTAQERPQAIGNAAGRIGMEIGTELRHHIISGMAHGDDFVVTGPTVRLIGLENKLAGVCPINKSSVLGRQRTSTL